MRERRFYTGAAVFMLMLALGLTLFPAAQQMLTLIVNGQQSHVAVLQINGNPYVELAGLARATNSSLTLKGSEITLTMPLSASGSSGTSSTVSSADARGLSRSFLKAAIEAMSSMREWHSALADAIQNQYPIAENWLVNYQNETATNLRLASLATSGDADRNALQLITNVFNSMKRLSDYYFGKRQSQSYISPDSLKDSDLDKKIVTCGHSLAAMVASGQFQDDGSCQ